MYVHLIRLHEILYADNRMLNMLLLKRKDFDFISGSSTQYFHLHFYIYWQILCSYKILNSDQNLGKGFKRSVTISPEHIFTT